MSSAASPNPQQPLLKALLEPLLTDFQDWFARARSLLEATDLTILSADQQRHLLARVIEAQQQVAVAQLLFQATGEQVGVEMAQMAAWHRLVTECWQVSHQWRLARGDLSLEGE